MHRHLLTVTFVAFAALVQAQTAKNPLPLTIGEENKYEYSGGYSTPVWAYTPAEDQLVTISPVTDIASITVTYDGNAYSSTKAPSVKYDGKYIFIAEKDVQIFLNVTAYASPVTFEATAESYPYQLGRTAAEAIEIKADGKAKFIPFREENYTEVPVHLRYSATEDGVLDLRASGYIHNAYFAEGAEGEFVGITCKRDGNDYRTSIPVEAGKEYILRISSTAAKMLTAEVIHPVIGESADYPFVITGTEAQVPAKAGKYYYEVTGTESGYGVVSSDVTDLDGTVSWGRSVESGLVTVSDGSFDLRQPATLGGHYYIIVDKKSDTAQAQKFAVRFEKTQPFDYFDTAAAINVGEDLKLPPYPGTYYYRVVVPSEGAYNLTAAPAVPFSDKNSSIRLYESTNSSTAKYIGEPDVICEVEAGKEYILKLITTEADKRTTLTTALTELAQGDGASNPFIVAIGENALPAGASKYYLYSAKKTSWVVITPSDMTINAPVVRRLKNEKYSSEQNITILRHGDAYRFEAEDGCDYLIRFTKVKEPVTFDFAVPDYEKGESAGNPFDIEGSAFAVPSTPGTYYWSYTPEHAGKLHLSTDFKYDVVSSPTRENSVKLLSADGNVLTSLPVDYTAETFGAAKYNVDDNTQYLIQVTIVSEQQGATVTLELGDLDPGETPAVAIHIDYAQVPFEYYFPKLGSRSEGKWYSIDLKEGDLSILSTNSISLYLYKADDYDNYLAYGKYHWDIDASQYGVKDFAVPEAGRYYFITYYWYTPEAPVTFSGSALALTDAIVLPEAASEEFTIDRNVVTANIPLYVYDLSGRCAANLAAGAQTTLSSGIYLIKTAATTAKVMIK